MISFFQVTLSTELAYDEREDVQTFALGGIDDVKQLLEGIGVPFTGLEDGKFHWYKPNVPDEEDDGTYDSKDLCVLVVEVPITPVPDIVIWKDHEAQLDRFNEMSFPKKSYKIK